jgi:endonuclease/exonuclease/phosphatase (EEP) superfamily protein YafD
MTRPRVVGAVLLLPVWILTIGLAALALTRRFDDDPNKYLAMAHAQTVWIYLPAYIVCSAAILFHRKTLAVLAAFVLFTHAWAVLDSIGIPERVPARAIPLRIVTANLRYDNPDRPRLAAELAGYDGDVLLLQEVTPAWVEDLDAAFGATYPHVVHRARSDAGGLAIYSRIPFKFVREIETEYWPELAVRLDFEPQVTLVNVHAIGPPQGMDRHDATIAAIAAFVDGFRPPRVVAGDFNATPYNASMERMYNLALEDAHERRGRGLATTWPKTEKPFPPIRIDHVLVDDEVFVRSIREGEGAGSDHRPVVANLGLMTGDAYPSDD